MVNAPASISPATYRIETLLPDSPRVRDAAQIQLAAFDPFVEYQSVIEPLPRAPLEVRLDRLELRINEKLRAKSKSIPGESESESGSSHLGYVAVNEQTGETVGMSYWMRPGRSHKLPDKEISAGKMSEEQKEAWEGWDTGRYGKLYEAFQGKMSAVLSERGEEEGCWYLEILAIHPSYQGLRLGPKLLDHHLAQIDHGENTDVRNAPAYLESSPPAKRLYTSRGFEDVGDVTADGWEDAFPAMFRPRMKTG